MDVTIKGRVRKIISATVGQYDKTIIVLGNEHASEYAKGSGNDSLVVDFFGKGAEAAKDYCNVGDYIEIVITLESRENPNKADQYFTALKGFKKPKILQAAQQVAAPQMAQNGAKYTVPEQYTQGNYTGYMRRNIGTGAAEWCAANADVNSDIPFPAPPPPPPPTQHAQTMPPPPTQQAQAAPAHNPMHAQPATVPSWQQQAPDPAGDIPF